MGNPQNPLAARLEGAAGMLLADPAKVEAGSEDVSLLRYLGYDDGEAARSDNRARMLRAAARFRRMFLLPVPDAPGLIFFGGEADPAIFGKRYEGLPVGNLAGSGTTPQRAFESWGGEGIEYLSQFVRDDDVIELAPLTSRLRSYAEARELDVRRFVTECLAAASIDANRPISWVMAKCLTDGARVWFPLDLCYRRRAPEQDFSPRLKLSSGCAAGPTMEAATLRGLLELVERDAVALWW